MAEEATQTPDEAAVAAAAAQAEADKAAAEEAAKAKADEDAAKEGDDKPADDASKTDADEGADEGEDAGEEGEGEEKKTELDATVWGSTGNETGDAVLKVLQDAGADPQAAKAILFDAIQSGDATQIDKAALADLIGDAQATIVVQGAKTFIAETNEANAAIVKTVHGAVGGEENWTKVSEWAKKSLPEAEMADYAEMIDAGGAKARFAAAEMLSAYNGDANNTSISKPRVEAEANTSTPSVEGITSRQYVEALEKAHRTKADASEIAKIKAQRAAGRKQGLK